MTAQQRLRVFTVKHAAVAHYHDVFGEGQRFAHIVSNQHLAVRIPPGTDGAGEILSTSGAAEKRAQLQQAMATLNSLAA